MFAQEKKMFLRLTHLLFTRKKNICTKLANGIDTKSVKGRKTSGNENRLNLGKLLCEKEVSDEIEMQRIKVSREKFMASEVNKISTFREIFKPCFYQRQNIGP